MAMGFSIWFCERPPQQKQPGPRTTSLVFTEAPQESQFIDWNAPVCIMQPWVLGLPQAPINHLLDFSLLSLPHKYFLPNSKTEP